MHPLVSSAALKEIAAAKGVQDTQILGDVGGYRIRVRYDNQQRELAARTRDGKSRPRTFRSLDAAARYLREIGLMHYQVDASRFQPVKVTRPDSAATLRSTHEAASYDRWFREQVGIGIEAANRGELVSEKEAESSFQSLDDELTRAIRRA
jgi:hypothetical protein